jgi:hypothetical protein
MISGTRSERYTVTEDGTTIYCSTVEVARIACGNQSIGQQDIDMPAEAQRNLEHWLKIIGVAVTVAGLLAGTDQFTRTQAVEAARPFLEKTLRWCEEAVEVAAGIAIYGRDSVLPSASPVPTVRRVDRFWSLYWGVMGMVENEQITKAMIAFGDGLNSAAAAGSDGGRSLDIAHACRSEMARDWSPVWRSGTPSS